MTKGPVSQRPAPLFLDSNDVDWNMSSLGVVLQTIEDGPTISIR